MVNNRFKNKVHGALSRTKVKEIINEFGRCESLLVGMLINKWLF